MRARRAPPVRRPRLSAGSGGTAVPAGPERFRHCLLYTSDAADEYRADLCYLGHLNAIKEELTPLENLLAAARLADEEISEDDAIDALEQVGLAGREDLACKYLSQGQKRRVALARLVKEKRPLWILDEPFVALDTAAVDWLAGIISGHLQRGGMAVMTTHQLVTIPAGTVRELRLS